MSEFQYKAGINNVGSYQVSAIPYVARVSAPIVSNTPLQLNFPTITKYLIIKNIDSTPLDVRVGFSENGIKGTNYFVLTQFESITLDVKVSSVFLISDSSNIVEMSVIAGLTGIDASQLPNNWSGSAGIG